MRAVHIAGVAQRLCHREIGVVQLYILADKPDGHGLRAIADALQHIVPVAHVDRGRVDAQLTADNRGEIALFQHDGRFIQHGQGDVLNHAVRLDIAEHRNFAENLGFKRLVAAENNDVRVDAHALQFLDRVLRGFGLVLVRAAEEGNQRHMNEQTVFTTDLE